MGIPHGNLAIAMAHPWNFRMGIPGGFNLLIKNNQNLARWLLTSALLQTISGFCGHTSTHIHYDTIRYDRRD